MSAAEKLAEIGTRVAATMSPEFSSHGGDLGTQGRISKTDFETIMLLASGAAGPAVSSNGIGCVKPDTDKQVFFYEQDFYVLSNFSSFNLVWKWITFPTVEHAYHWEKFPDNGALRMCIARSSSAHQAFKWAQDHGNQVREDWPEVRIGIMREMLRAKAAQHEYVRRKLLATGDRELIEDSWRDAFWGWGPNRDGKNMLGKLWMEVRAELRNSEPV